MVVPLAVTSPCLSMEDRKYTARGGNGEKTSTPAEVSGGLARNTSRTEFPFQGIEPRDLQTQGLPRFTTRLFTSPQVWGDAGLIIPGRP